MIDQIIPLPYGMLAFKEIENDYAAIFMSYQEYETVTAPGFTGKRVSAYIKLGDVTTDLRHIQNAFLSSEDYNDTRKDDVADFYNQCLLKFNVANLNSFKENCHDIDACKPFSLASNFQTNVVKCWNPNSAKHTKSVYLGLLSVDKVAVGNTETSLWI